jgi:hypothetical protein
MSRSGLYVSVLALILAGIAGAAERPVKVTDIVLQKDQKGRRYIAGKVGEMFQITLPREITLDSNHPIKEVVVEVDGECVALSSVLRLPIRHKDGAFQGDHDICVFLKALKPGRGAIAVTALNEQGQPLSQRFQTDFAVVEK